MFVVSFHEQNIQFDLHSSEKDTFSHYQFDTDGSNKITGGRTTNPINKIIIYGYLSKYNTNIGRVHNMYYGDHFSVMEVLDREWEHLNAEWGSANPTLREGIIFAEKKQADAIAKAKERVKNGLPSLNTGARPLRINTAYTESLKKRESPITLPEAKLLQSHERI